MIVFVAAMLPMVGQMKHPPGPETTIFGIDATNETVLKLVDGLDLSLVANKISLIEFVDTLPISMV